MSELTDFLESIGACDELCEWAVSTGCKTVKKLWLRDDLKPEWRILLACHVLPQSVLRKFVFSCAFDVLHLMDDPRSKQSLNVAKQYVDIVEAKNGLKEAMDEADRAEYGALPKGNEHSPKEWAAWSAACVAKYAVSTVIESNIRFAAMQAAKAAARAFSDAACFAVNAEVGSKVGAAAREEVGKRQSALLLELAPTLRGMKL